MKLEVGDTFTADNILLAIVELPDGTQGLAIADTGDAEFYVSDDNTVSGQRAVSWNSSIGSYEAEDEEDDEDEYQHADDCDAINPHNMESDCTCRPKKDEAIESRPPDMNNFYAG